MEILSDNKHEIVEKFVKILDTKSLIFKSTRIALCYLFAQYCLSDLNIEQCFMNFEKKIKGNYGSFLGDTISLNTMYLKKDLSLMLNTIAHEIRHKKQSDNPKLKKINQKNIITYPIEHYNPLILFFLNDETSWNHSMYFCSKREKDAREYALEIFEKFLIDVKLQNTAFSTAWANKMLEKNDMFKNREKESYNTELKNITDLSEKIKKDASNLINKLIDKSLGEKIPFSNNIFEYYTKNTMKEKNSFAKTYSILLNYINSDEICQKLYDASIKIKDIDTLSMMVNHYYVNLSEQQILKFLFLVLEKRSLNYFDAKQYFLFGFDNENIVYLTKKYNEELEKYSSNNNQKKDEFKQKDDKNNENNLNF